MQAHCAAYQRSGHEAWPTAIPDVGSARLGLPPALPVIDRGQRRAASILRDVKALRRLGVCVTILARDRRIPKPPRGAVAVGSMWLPGPLDDAILLLVAVPALLFYRQSMRAALEQARSR